VSATELRERLLGSWLLVSCEARDAASEVTYPLGRDAIGQLTYDAQGRMSAQLMRNHQPLFADDDPRRATIREKEVAWDGYFGYFGTYDIDEEAGALTHQIVGSWFPNLVGTQQVRRFQLDGNRLTVSAETPWGNIVNVWEKPTFRVER
jgi:hypothetical protein